MNDIEALHTAARRYCEERDELWQERYRKLVISGRDRVAVWGPYTDDAYRTFPRYSVLTAIREGLEALVPGDFSSLEAMREAIIKTGLTANDEFTQPPGHLLAEESMAEERRLFCKYVAELGEAELASVPPLPYRRTLGPDESESVRERMRAKWGACEGYWHPLIAESLSEDVIALQSGSLEGEMGLDVLRQVLEGHGIERVLELTNTRSDREIEVSLVGPFNDSSFYTSEPLDWVLYLSPERSLTVAGEWLIGEIKRVWPGWEDKVWYWDWNRE